MLGAAYADRLGPNSILARLIQGYPRVFPKLPESTQVRLFSWCSRVAVQELFTSLGCVFSLSFVFASVISSIFTPSGQTQGLQRRTGTNEGWKSITLAPVCQFCAVQDLDGRFYLGGVYRLLCCSVTCDCYHHANTDKRGPLCVFLNRR